MTTKAAQAENNEALDRLRDILKPGTTVHTILRNVSSSGMSRAVSAVVINKDGSIFYLDGLIARSGLFKTHPKYDGLKLDGCGMDMGFHLVYSLSRALYPNGYKCTGHDGSKRAPRCMSNDHANYRAETRGQEAPEPNYKKGKHHSDGGYALSQKWL
jgi:hypothetical protein